MTKSEILAALAERRKRGLIRGGSQQADDWESGFRAAEESVKRFMAAPLGLDLEPVTVVTAADKEQARTVYAPNLSAAEVCGPYNPARALDARKPETAACPLWRIA